MSQAYDAVVIGGGHNGLVAACYLAKAGKQVLVLERHHTVGGAAVTEEIYPGFRVSVASYSMSLMRPEIIEELRLADYGFEVYAKNPSYFMPYPDGSHLFLYAGDRERSKAQIAKFSPRDATNYDAWEDFWDRCCDIIEPTLLAPPPSMGELAQCFEDAGCADDWRRLMLLSMQDLMDEFFESPSVQAAMAPQSLISTMAGPATPGTPFVFLVHAIGRAIHGRRGVWGYVKGGMGTVTRTLAAAAADLGVTIRTSAPVAELLVESGVVSGVVLENGDTIRTRSVLSNAHPRTTFLQLCPENALPAEFRQRIANYRTGGTVYKLNLALHELPRYTAAPADVAPDICSRGTVDIAPTPAYLERAWDDFKRGECSKDPFIEIFSQSPTDPTMAPEGKHVLSCFCQFFPYQVKGRDWNDGLREEMADHILDKLAEYAPNIKAAVIARQMLSPLDLEARFGLVEGNIFHGEITPDQAFNLRPASGYADYRTPLPGLFLCGSGAHPGGGVTGIPGHNCAQVVLADR